MNLLYIVVAITISIVLLCVCFTKTSKTLLMTYSCDRYEGCTDPVFYDMDNMDNSIKELYKHYKKIVMYNADRRHDNYQITCIDYWDKKDVFVLTTKTAHTKKNKKTSAKQSAQLEICEISGDETSAGYKLWQNVNKKTMQYLIREWEYEKIFGKKIEITEISKPVKIVSLLT